MVQRVVAGGQQPVAADGPLRGPPLNRGIKAGEVLLSSAQIYRFGRTNLLLCYSFCTYSRRVF